MEIDSAVIEGFLSTPLIKPDIEEEDEHRTPESEVAAVVGILWKVNALWVGVSIKAYVRTAVGEGLFLSKRCKYLCLSD